MDKQQAERVSDAILEPARQVQDIRRNEIELKAHRLAHKQLQAKIAGPILLIFGAVGWQLATYLNISASKGILAGSIVGLAVGLFVARWKLKSTSTQ